MCHNALNFQCDEPTSLDEVAENASMVAVLTGDCHLASIEEAVGIVDTASPNKDLLEVYNPVRGSLDHAHSCCLYIVYKFCIYTRCRILQTLVNYLISCPLSSATTRFTCFHYK